MRRFVVALTLILALLPSAALAQSAAPCTFVLGFAALHDLLPAVVGNCLDDEQHNPANGDALQQTSAGLLVWRRSDNWTAFTDGYRTWINGPFGVQERLNTQRFAWEADANDMPSAGSGAPAQATYHICGPDAPTAQAIEQFIAGREVSTVLAGDANGCADLTITIQGTAGISNGQSISTETVGHISVRVATANGATHVTIATV
jgi:hypothetical protein